MLCYKLAVQTATSVALSTMEACAATQEALWLLRLLKELGCQFTELVTILEKNKHVFITKEIQVIFNVLNISIRSIISFVNKSLPEM